MTKRKKRIILLLIILIGGMFFFYLGKREYDVNLAELKNNAKNAFIKALNEELCNRKIEGGLTFSVSTKQLLKFDELPEVVTIIGKNGVRIYKIDPIKHHLNVTSDSNLRFLQGFSFEKNPIQPDSLNIKWKSFLMKQNISNQSALRVSVADLEENIKTIATLNSKWCTDRNMVFTIYIGYRCEIEVSGFLDFSAWSVLGWQSLLYLLLYSILIGICLKLMPLIYKKMYLTPRVEIKEVPIPVLQEVPVVQLVKETVPTAIRSYQIRENFIFYAEHKRIEVNGEERNIRPQVALLLELFLNTPNHLLTDDEIYSALWPNGSGTSERLHKVIDRLRAALNTEPPILVVRSGGSSYQVLFG